MSGLQIFNAFAVGVFGVVLSALFCDISWTPRKRWIMVGCAAAIFLAQGLIYLGVGPVIGRNLYPLHTHIPLMIVLGFLSKNCLWSAISVLTAYLCCQLRRWLALLIVWIACGSLTQAAVELVLTLPLVLLLR
mgnify:CR=1 FL=1